MIHPLAMRLTGGRLLKKIGSRGVVQFFLFISLLMRPLYAEWQSIRAPRVEPPIANQIIFRGQSGIMVLSILAPDLIRVRMSPGKVIGPDYSYAVVKRDWTSVPVEFKADKENQIIRTSELEVRVSLSPLRIDFYDLSGRLISKDSRGMAWDGERVRAWKWMPPDEHYFGLGEKAGPLDKRGYAFVMWNTDPTGYDALTDPMYKSIPFFVGLRAGRAYGIFFDNTYRSSFDMGALSPDEYSFGAEGGEMDYYFFYGPDPKKVIARFTELVGRTPLPPKWSLGYIQSSIKYYPESTVRFVAGNFRQRRIPCDALFLDNRHMDGNRVFTWDKNFFPDPARLLSDLRRQGFRIFAIMDPGVKVDDKYWVYQQGVAGEHFLKRKDGRIYTGIIWPGESAFPDFSSERTRDWYASLFEGFAKDGLAGFLTDMNEPTVDDVPLSQGWFPRALDPDVIHWDQGLKTPHSKNHNVYGMLMSQATREGLLRFRPNERPFVITRATYAGGQRYAAQWTGDNFGTWEHLRSSLRICLSMGISGLPFVGSDIGGFGDTPSPELYTRWLQAGIFHPYFWTHTGDPERTVDPWSFGSGLEQINRSWIELRYRLLPYLYNAFYQSTQTGLPIMRGLMLDFPDEPAAFDPTPAGQNDEFLFGEDLLVAPVVKDGELRRKVYLPRGSWIDYWTDQPYVGPSKITVEAPLERIPIFVRAGTILPTQQVTQYVDEAPMDPLTFEIFPEGNSSREYYEDDGISFDYQQGVFLKQRLHVSRGSDTLLIQISAREGKYIPPDRSIVLRIHRQQSPPSHVKVAGVSMETKSQTVSPNNAGEGATYDEERRILSIKFPDRGNELEVKIQ